MLFVTSEKSFVSTEEKQNISLEFSKSLESLHETYRTYKQLSSTSSTPLSKACRMFSDPQ